MGSKWRFQPGFNRFVESNFFVFFLGAIFGGVMEITHGAQSIALWMSKLTHRRCVLPLIMTITGILAIGGVSGFVVYFAVYPIALNLCKKANISRNLIPAAIGSGCWTFAMTAPCTPSLPNIIAMKSLGTPSTAGIFSGILLCGVLEYICVFAYLEWQTYKYKKKKVFFVIDKSIEEELQRNQGIEHELPNVILSLLPLGIIVVLFNVFHIAIELSLLAGILEGMITLYKYGGSRKNWLDMCNKGAGNSAVVILNTALVVGFASVIKETEAFSLLIANLTDLSLNPLLYIALTSGICCIATASGSGGTAMAFESFKNIYLSLGIAPEIIHRIVVASSPLGTLPHTGGQITLLNICKVTHKEAFGHIFMTEFFIPAVILGCLILWYTF